MGVHTVCLAAQDRLEEHLGDEDVHHHEHDRVGGRDREGGTSWGQGHDDAGGEDKEECSEDKELGVHFYN